MKAVLLEHIIEKLEGIKVIGGTARFVRGLSLDTRKLNSDFLFAALKGSITDGHQFIEAAIEKGATVILCEDIPSKIHQEITYLVVEDSKRYLGLLAAEFFGHPSNNVKVIGVTGTNGKTTIATLLFDLFTELGFICGLLSTVENRINDKKIPSTHTTPDIITINELLTEMLDEGCEYVFMEVSSHGIHQSRTVGINFLGGVFTNLTHDHLDYHGSFDEYLKIKKQFFDEMPKSSFSLVNVDDRHGKIMVQNTKSKVYTYSLHTRADFKTTIIENQIDGLQLRINDVDVHCRLIGKFNAYNLTAIYAIAEILGIDSFEALEKVSNLHSAEGRFHIIRSSDQKTVVVDYAHTPDALKNVLNTLQEIALGQRKIITVFGAGGDRDAAKRPLMGAEVSKRSDRVIITTDNPRFEDPQLIMADIKSGVSAAHQHKILSIPDRKEAISLSLQLANPGDIILVAGKGHEKYMEIEGKRFHFDDVEEVEANINTDINHNISLN